MKDLTEQIYDELNAQVVRMLNHSLNQASRIVELETQLKDHSAQAFSIGETYANALSRIAELEAQIAAASAPADTDKLRELRARIYEMKEAAYTYGDNSKEAVCAALDGVLDEIDEVASTALQAPVREVPETWISVEDRLPKVEELVIVYAPAGKHSEERIDFDFIDPNDDDHASWFHHNEHYEHFCVVAKPEGSIGPSEKAPYTHWLPLPAAPVQQEGA